MKIKMCASGVPAGVYAAEFVGIEAADHPEYGPGWRWVFEVLDGTYAGERVTRTTKNKPTAKNSAGRFLAMLVGRQPSESQEIDTDAYVGRRYTVMVEPSPGGEATRVASFARGSAEEAAEVF